MGVSAVYVHFVVLDLDIDTLFDVAGLQVGQPGLAWPQALLFVPLVLDLCVPVHVDVGPGCRVVINQAGHP